MAAKNGKFKYVILITLVFLVGVYFGKGLDRVLASSDSIYNELELFTDALNLIRENYVEDVDTQELIYGAIRGMASSLDDHSAFFSPDEFKEFQVETKGSFGGLGIEISIIDGVLTIVSPIEDTPAWRAGLKANDKIIEIEGESTEGITLFEAVKKLRGTKGTSVTITIMREGLTKPKEFTIVRDIIKIKSVKYELYDNNIAYIRITQFQDRTAVDLRKALDDIIDKSGGEITGIILDLRNDPGGLLGRSVEVADMFLEEGIIVSTKGRVEGTGMTFRAHREGTIPDVPMVVLINGGSASASEIVAGALKDQKRAILVGTITFGKGSVQTIIPMVDGSGIKITTAKYYTPDGISIQDTGIEPDIIVELPEETEMEVVTPEEGEEAEEPLDTQLEKAKEVLLNWDDYKYILN